MLSKKIQDALNRQIAEEDQASHQYLAMASWCDKSGLPGSAGFLYAQSEQERAHMMRLFRYVNDAGGHALSASVKPSVNDFQSIKEVFEKTLEYEKQVTASINAVVSLCLDAKDYSTFHFLQWYVAEQHEEEKTLKGVLDLIRVAGTEGRGLFLIDKEIGKMHAEVKS